MRPPGTAPKGLNAVEKVLAVPVEALFRKNETEIVYVKKAPAPQAADSGGFLSRVFAAGKKDASTPLPEKDRWKEQFDVREVETGLASFDRVQIVNGLKDGDEIAVEDPSRPKEKKERE